MNRFIITDSVMSYAICPRRAFFVLRGEPEGILHEYERVVQERDESERGQGRRGRIRRIGATFLVVRQKIPSQSLITRSRSPRGVLRMVNHYHGVLNYGSCLAAQGQLLAISFLHRPRSCRQSPARKHAPAAAGCTAPITHVSRGAAVMNFPKQYGYRLSFCCDRDGCRKRVTPPSVRFLGRKVYLGAVVVLVAAMRQGATPRRVRELSKLFGADRRTIARWQTFWREHFPQTRFWKVARALLVPAVEVAVLPRALVEAFLRDGDPCQGWGRLLRFLSPITVAGGLDSKVFR